MKDKGGVKKIKTVCDVTLIVRMNSDGEVIDVLETIEVGDIVGDITIITNL
jgi:hypothetical protein